MVREYEEELVWANFGVRVKDVHHLRLGFYQGEIFTEQPENARDVAPVLEQLKLINPTVISLALDPEGSGGMRPVDPASLGATEGEPDAALRSMAVDTAGMTADANIAKPKGGEI